MKINEILSDKAILIEIGKRIQTIRVMENMTQAEMAKKTGISLSTIARMEQGVSVKTDHLIMVMRALKIIDNLEFVFPKEELHPIELADKREKKRKRASKKTVETQTRNWKWGDER